MQPDRYEEPTKPFTPIPIDGLVWSPGELTSDGLELDAELVPAFMFLERNRDALRFVGPALVQDADFVIGVLRHAPVLEGLPRYVIESLVRRSDVSFVSRITRFSPAERREIAAALVALEECYQGTPRQRAVTVALDSYWRSLLD